MERILNYYVDMWRNYANFSGRTNVTGYWWAALVNFILGRVLRYIPYVGTIYSLAVLVPELAISVRRLNDAGKHWAWIFANIVPMIGQIVFIFMLCQPSKDPNIIDME